MRDRFRPHREIAIVVDHRESISEGVDQTRRAMKKLNYLGGCERPPGSTDAAAAGDAVADYFERPAPPCFIRARP
jgi:hypothetical protein